MTSTSGAIPDTADVDRLHTIWLRSLDAMRQVVADLKITEDELHIAADYFTRLAQSGMFRSFIDVSLSIASLDATLAGKGGTRANVEGPFYRPGAPFRPDGNLIERELSADAEVVTVTGRVTDAKTGAPIAGAELDLWQADEHGIYDRTGWHLHGVVRSGADGTYHVRTVVPNDYSQHEHDPIGELYRALGRHSYRAAHIHLKVRVAGVHRLTTQFFMAQSPILDSDYVIGAVSHDLIVQKHAVTNGAGEIEQAIAFDIALPPL
jgi:protocatechuate 3,4-dioxygenase beta subunit